MTRTEIQPSISFLYLRIFASLISFLLAWKFLKTWYSFHHRSDYLAFSILFLIALFAILPPFFQYFLTNASRFRKWLVLLFVLIFLPYSEWLNLNGSLHNWSHDLYFKGIFLCSILTLFMVWPEVSLFLQRIFFQSLDSLSARKYFLWIPSVCFFLLTSWIAVVVSGGTSVLIDSVTYLFQAKIFAQGHLNAPQPPFPEFFSYNGDLLIFQNGRWMSPYLPGFPLLLTPAFLLGLENFVCPLLGGLSIAIWTGYVRTYHGRRTAMLFSILALFSPFLFNMFSMIMIHTIELFIVSAAFYLCRLETEQRSLSREILLFFIFAILIVVRPYSILPFLFPVVFYLFLILYQSRSWRSIALLIAGFVCGAILLLLFQWAQFGHPLLDGHKLELGDKYGFAYSLGRQHTPLRGLENTSSHFLGLDEWLTGWYSGSLIFWVIFFFKEKKLQTWDRILILSCLLLALFYFFYVYLDLLYGPRFFFLMAPAGLLFLVRAAEIDRSDITQQQSWVSAMLIISFLTFLPFRFSEFINMKRIDRKQSLLHTIQQAPAKKAIIFLDGQSRGLLASNDPFLKGDVLYCIDRGPEDQKILEAYPDHQPYFYVLNNSVRGMSVSWNRQLSSHPQPPSQLSFYRLAATMDSVPKILGQDLFDVCYRTLLAWSDAGAQIAYIDSEKDRIFNAGTPDQASFRKGLYFTARFLLLPKKAFDQHQDHWKDNFDLATFRSNFDSAKTEFARAGELGKAPSAELDKLEERMDVNQDSSVSNAESLAFLQSKLNSYSIGQ